MPCLQAFLFILLTNVLFLIYLVSVFADFQFCIPLCSLSNLLFYIRHIAWCIFISFVNKSSMSLTLYYVVA